jgi:hypothetical protein
MQPYFDPTRKMTSTKKGRRPQKNKLEDDLKKNMKMEDDIMTYIMTRMKTSKKWKTTSKKRKKEKSKDEPINQNQPNWL